jgi:hypothetical protein
MLRSIPAALVVASTLLVAVAASAQPRAGTAELPPLRFGGGVFDVGVDVGPYRLLEPSTSVGFDLRLRWPSPAALGDLATVQPYFLLGPTFFMTDPDPVTRALDPRADTTYGLGVRAGAGLTWTLDPNATLFGEYRVTRGGGERLLPLGRSASDVSGYDLMYGVRVRF